MKKIMTLFALALCACQGEEQQVEQNVNNSDLQTITEDIVLLENFNGYGVDLQIENMYGTRVDNNALYLLSVTKPNRTLEINFIMKVDVLSDGGYKVALYTDDADDDSEFLGAFIYDATDRLSDVIVSYETSARKEGECYVDCVKREYKERKDAMAERPLDDVACSWMGGICNTLILAGAAYDCCDTEDNMTTE